MYNCNEDAGSIQIELVLSGESSTDITVEVSNTDGSATGEYWLSTNTMMIWLTC